jgi:DNA polymerase III delta prime subunit
MKPAPITIKNRIKQIIENEKLNIDDITLDRLIESTGGSDIR